MGWGDPPHEGYGARKLTPEAATRNAWPDQGDVSWTSTWTGETRGTEGWQARCSCGWRSGVFHPNPRTDGVDVAPEALEERMYTEWRDTHMAPMVDPDPDHVLVLAEDGGGRRHFLAGRPVHAGAGLELRLRDDVWVRIRYEWSWRADEAPRGYLALGGRGEALGWEPEAVEFKLPERAELRWPEGD